MPNKRYFSEIDQIKKDVSFIKEKIQPDKLAQSLDKSYMSIHNLRGFLQILSLIMTIFMAGAVGFGYLGVKNILDLNQEMNKMRQLTDNFTKLNDEARNQYDDKIISINDIEKSFKKSYNDILSSQKRSKRILDSLFINIRSDHDKLQYDVNQDINKLRKNISSIDTSLQNLGKIYYNTALKYGSIFNGREQALLLILSSTIYETTDIQPENKGLFYYNLAVNFNNIGEYEIAINFFNYALKIQPDLSSKKVNDIKKLIDNCNNKLRERNQVLSIKSLDSLNVSFNDQIEFGPRFAESLLKFLVENGYIKNNQAEEIKNQIWSDKINK